MTLGEIHMLLEDFNNIRRIIGKAKIDISTGWNRLAMEDMESLNKELTKIQERVILEKTLEVLKEPVVEL